MSFTITKTGLKDILPLRARFLQENNFQIRYNATHERGWSDSFLIEDGEASMGYGAIKGKEHISDRDTVFEFYVLPAFRTNASALFSELLRISGASYIECQSNEPLLTTLLNQFGHDITSDVILFEAGETSALFNQDAIFRRRANDDMIFEHKHEPVGSYVLEAQKSIVATGGFLFHYNFPFADLYMEVREDYRRKGFGSFLIQEIKKQCYLAGRVPAARCSSENVASKATLLKAGMKVAGYMMIASV